MLCKLFSCTLVAAALGKITWTSSKSERRLELELAHSHTDKSDADCIVGGYDEENPLKIYIGGPCSELSGNTPSASFKWVEMESVHLELVASDGTPAPFQHVEGSEFVYSKNGAEFAQVGVGASQRLEGSEMGHAAFHISTTSYLSKASFDYTTNDFIVEVNSDGTPNTTFTQCVAPCCAEPDHTECACASGCPTQALQAVQGDFKFSIMAASYDTPSETGSPFVAGVTGNGWQKVVETHGSGTPGSKTLSDVNMDYYQVIDFSNMKADTLTVTSPGGTSKKYVDMTACDLTSNAPSCNDAVEVKGMTVSSDGAWSASYVFPQTSNVGSWSEAADPVVDATRKVQIHCIKPNDATLVSWGIAADTTAAAQKKVVLVRYRFDIDGITADGTTGKWMNYDPTITSGNGTASTGTTTGATAVVSNAPRTFAHFGLMALMAALSAIASM